MAHRKYLFQDIVQVSAARGSWPGVVIGEITIGDRPAYIVHPFIDDKVNTVTRVLESDIDGIAGNIPAFEEGKRYQLFDLPVTLLNTEDQEYIVKTSTGRKIKCPRWHLIVSNHNLL